MYHISHLDMFGIILRHISSPKIIKAHPVQSTLSPCLVALMSQWNIHAYS